jgi:hypothetical protein
VCGIRNVRLVLVAAGRRSLPSVTMQANNASRKPGGAFPHRRRSRNARRPDTWAGASRRELKTPAEAARPTGQPAIPAARKEYPQLALSMPDSGLRSKATTGVGEWKAGSVAQLLARL